MARVKDVAKIAKVSPSTVSRFVRSPEVVTEAKRKRIEAAIAQVGYVRNLNASSLKSNSSNLVGIILPAEQNLFFSSLVNRLNKTLFPEKKLIVFYAEDFNEVKNNVSTLLSLRVSAILFIPEKKSNTISTLTLSNNCYPLQLFVDNFPTFDSILIDDRNGAYLAAKKLMECGHKKTLLIDGDNDVFQLRKYGYRTAIEEFGEIFDERSVLSLKSMENCEAIMSERIKEYKPTAVICVTELLAQRLCFVFQKENISIPDDISLIVYDDSAWAELCGYTAVSQPLETVVENINALIKMNSGNYALPSSPIKIKLQPFLTERRSIKNLN
ncbi:MAG: LacI family DNA-binding transcriptional regulator [Clostridia bacterium]|nr:LacI family DNA-binding transcriptional regulator [Clostridia bacterium]